MYGKLLASLTRIRVVGVASAAMLILILGQNAYSASDTCRDAADIAALETGVPSEVLLHLNALAAVTGSKGASPWTVTISGQSPARFATEDAAAAYLFSRFIRGSRHFSVGCFQVSYAMDGHAFASIEGMFDPRQNAIVAARRLQSLHLHGRSWNEAVSAYPARALRLAALQPKMDHGASENAVLKRVAGSSLPVNTSSEAS